MKISVVPLDKIKLYDIEINQLLKETFGENSHIEINNEFVCAVLIHRKNRLLACGFAYQRTMKQSNSTFKAGILGGIAVIPKQRGNGLSKLIVSSLDSYLTSKHTIHSFLFAYEPNVYRSSGYSKLNIPIYYFDHHKECWNEFIYRGGMVKSYTDAKLLLKHRIEFRGCVY